MKRAMSEHAWWAVQDRLDRERMRQELLQPWRCAACGTPVRPGAGDPCRCIPNPER